MLAPLLLALVQDDPSAAPEDLDPLAIGIAAEVLGLHYSEKELELMLPDVRDRRADLERLRALPLTNDVAPVLYFFPAPARLESAQSTPPARPQAAPLDAIPARPADLEALAFASIDALQGLLASRAVTSVELTQVFLARLERLDPQLHCVVTLTRERALRQAEERDRERTAGTLRGPLHGIPWVAKDLLAVKGYPTTWGSPPFREQVLDFDAAVVERLDAAGAVLIAKVSLGELAWGDVWFGGRTRNPWKPEQGSSGSSAGSASAVAAGCAPFAIGSETYGSIVSPSSVCGNSSLRPTFGRVSRYGAMTLSWSLDKLGPICRSAVDARRVLEAIAGADARDPSTLDTPLGSGPHTLQGVRVGLPRGAFEGPGAACKPVLDELRDLGAELVEVELPTYPVEEMMIVLTAEAGAAFDDFSRGTGDDAMVRQTRDAWPNVFRQAALVPAVDYIRANRLRSLLIRDWERLLSGIEVLVYPSFHDSLVAATNLSGHPTFVAPCGFREDGTPFSISFTSRLFADGELLDIVAAWQPRNGAFARHPQL